MVHEAVRIELLNGSRGLRNCCRLAGPYSRGILRSTARLKRNWNCQRKNRISSPWNS